MSEEFKHYTDEEIVASDTLMKDKDGVWRLEENEGRRLIEPSQEWFDKNPIAEEKRQEPTPEERLAALELAMIDMLLG